MNRSNRLLLAATVALALCSGTPGPQKSESADAERLPDGEVARRIDAYVRPLNEAGELFGVLLVARGERVVYERAFGMASYELGVANGPTTRFAIASLTKPITVALAVRLIEQEKLNLHDPLSKWLPDFPRGDEITVEHLLRHRSGLPHRVTTPAEETVRRTAADMVELAKRAELLFDPGSRSAYSSAGYSVLARVLELAGGESWAELVENVVLAPLGAARTAHPDARRVMEGQARSYFRGPHGPLPAPLKDLSFLVGAGSLYSTASDVLAVQRAILDGFFGDGVRQRLAEDGSLRWSGITNGFRAFADHHGEMELTVIWTANLFTGAADLLRRDVPRIAAGEEVEAPRVPEVQPVAVAPERAAHYEGLYRLRPGSEEELRIDGMFATLGEWILIPTSETTFFSPQDYGTVNVVTGEDGVITGLSWQTGDEPIHFPRVRDLALPR